MVKVVSYFIIKYTLESKENTFKDVISNTAVFCHELYWLKLI